MPAEPAAHEPAASPEALRLSGIAEHVNRFKAYVGAFLGDALDDTHFLLKQEHSLRVLEWANLIAGAEDAFIRDVPLSRSLLLAALYHDIGRFQQYTLYRTFSDKVSEDHAALGVRELLRGGYLDDESPGVRGTVLTAVRQHNRLAVDADVTGAERAVALALRDADKLDIMRVMRAHLCDGASPDAVVVLHVEDSMEVSPAILEAAMARRMARYADMRTTADFRLLLCTWLYDLNYETSRLAAVASGHARAFLAGLPETGAAAAFRTQYLRDMRAYDQGEG